MRRDKEEILNVMNEETDYAYENAQFGCRLSQRTLELTWMGQRK